ncbi:MAG: hypothetical protein GOMPHAMPRED_002282 [Gomphillus americanus]|uniref:Uncharacterized protein n=1 Tax=Gomphillus americanus TaxID=1940652 RepID=A0A8H3IN36_9LECA|nr:MAG: hypothetical protein GOMPHAMPRED_002282 [Gomphillus americanus]
MSLTQTYFLAHTARAKLSKEASRGDHNLRLLVGHANLLDGLMIDLVEAERAQEALFNAAATHQSHVQWAPEPSRQPTITEDYEEEDDSDSDSEDEEMEKPIAQLSRRQPTISTDSYEDEEEDQATDDEEDDYEHLALVRTPSRSSPPELLHELDDDSDEESLPSTPSSPDMQLSLVGVPNKKGSKEEMQESFYEDGFYLPTRPAVAIY